MRKSQRTSLLVLVALLVVTGCLMPSVTIVDPIAQATSLAQTVQVMVISSQPALGTALSATPAVPSPLASYTPISPTWTLIPTQTQTPSATPTSIVLATLTPFLPLISVSVPTNCRLGPGKVYEMVGALLVGEVAQIYAREPTGMYWYIRNPDAANGFCWVWGQYATLSGPTSSLPIYTPMPTPTATATETPSPSFDASYEGLVSCPADWWPEIGLENTGSITFRSTELVVKDTVTGETVSDLADSFVDRPDCSSSHSRATLLPGKNVVISSAALSNDPAGHKLRATITLCSEVEQSGMCVTRSITFKP